MIISLARIIVSLCLPKLPEVNECEAAAEPGIEAFEQSGVCVCVCISSLCVSVFFRAREDYSKTRKIEGGNGA